MGDVNIILFYSKRSRLSVSALELMARADIATVNVCLDNKSMRDRVLRGPYVQIKQVPTIAIVYPTGKVDVYSGLDKITAIVGAMTQRRHAARTPEVPVESVQTSRRKRKHRPNGTILPVENMYAAAAKAAASKPESVGDEIEIETTVGDDDDSDVETDLGTEMEETTGPVNIADAAENAEREREATLERMKQTFAQGQ